MAMMLRKKRKLFLGLIAIYLLKCIVFQIMKPETVVMKREQGGPGLTIRNKTQTNVTKRFTERRSTVRRKCVSADLTRMHILSLTGYATANLTMCNVPKTAGTLLLRLFSYLINKESSNRTILSLSKYDVHFTTMKSREDYRFHGEDQKYIMKSVRIMTTRHPYTRLWSAYIDKFLLPDFWKSKGIQIIQMMRPNATDEDKRCGYGVTFPEFIQYVLDIGHSIDNWGIDFHWLPVTDICDPCMFKPDFIVKQETFLSDFTHVVDMAGLIDDVKPILEVKQDEYQIENEIDYNLRQYKQISSCVSKLQLSKLIWKAMKLNGYLQPNDEFPAQLKEEKINKSTILEFVQAARNRNYSNKQTKEAIRKQVLIDAYRQLSVLQLTSLQWLYTVDFEMFDYDSSPPV